MHTPARERYLEFNYIEIKDLAKYFITMIAGTLVLSVSFAGNIVQIGQATLAQRMMLGLCWLFLFLALLLAGLGMYFNYLAGEKAKGEVVVRYSETFSNLAYKAYFLLDISAVLFGLALVCLAGAGAIRLFKAQTILLIGVIIFIFGAFVAIASYKSNPSSKDESNNGSKNIVLVSPYRIVFWLFFLYATLLFALTWSIFSE